MVKTKQESDMFC